MIDMYTAQRIVSTGKDYIIKNTRPSFREFCHDVSVQTGVSVINIKHLLNENHINEDTWSDVSLYYKRKKKSK